MNYELSANFNSGTIEPLEENGNLQACVTIQRRRSSSAVLYKYVTNETINAGICQKKSPV